jgi:dTDP-glucose 4,6-dehydratase
MKLLVTGGAGFIGSHFLRSQIIKNYWEKIVVLDSLTYAANLNNIKEFIDTSQIDFVKGDICDEKIVKYVMEDVSTVVHFAAESHVDRSIISSKPFITSNVLGTQNLLDQALKIGLQTFIHISTDEVYGSIENGSWNEIEPVKPNSPYSASKASSDLLALAYFRTYGLDVRVTRCSNNYGPNQHAEKLIPRFITNIIDGKKLPVYGKGNNRRDWLHVSDHCDAIDKVIEFGSAGEIYNIGGGTELSNIELTYRILKLMDVKDDIIEFVEDRKGHDFRYSVDYAKINRIGGYNPKIDFEQGLSSTIQWYVKNIGWWKKSAK